MLKGELEAHLLENQVAGISNRRNGKSSKQVQTSSDTFELLTPRDQEDSFDHQIRNLLKYLVSKDQKAFMVDLKLIYRASSKVLAEQ